MLFKRSNPIIQKLKSIFRYVFIGYKYYSLLVLCFHGIHFTETIQLFASVEPYWQLDEYWIAKKCHNRETKSGSTWLCAVL